MVHVGEKLSEERIRRGLTLEEVAKATKIRASFLQAIEKGEYKKLPSGTYVHGFVRNYAKFLGLPEYEILSLFKNLSKAAGRGALITFGQSNHAPVIFRPITFLFKSLTTV